MLNKIFGGKKDELIDMEVIWDDDVDANDLVEDLNRIGQYMCRPFAQKKGCRIITVRNWFINDRMVKQAELVVDKNIEKWIRLDLDEGRFKAVKGTSTIVGKPHNNDEQK